MNNNIGYVILLAVSLAIFGIFIMVAFHNNHFIDLALKGMANFIASTRPSV